MATPAKHGHNGMAPERVKNAVGEIEDLLSKKQRLHMGYMSECRAINEDIAAVYDAAKETGIQKKALRKVVKTRELERKVASIREDLEAEDQETFDQIRHALGDLAELPLGQAALDAKAERSAAADTLAH
jgi:uncharacterized protein (UPF0335 family)